MWKNGYQSRSEKKSPCACPTSDSSILIRSWSEVIIARVYDTLIENCILYPWLKFMLQQNAKYISAYLYLFSVQKIEQLFTSLSSIMHLKILKQKRKWLFYHKKRERIHKIGIKYRNIQEQYKTCSILKPRATALPIAPVACDYLRLLSMDIMQKLFFGGRDTHTHIHMETMQYQCKLCNGQ